MAMNTHPVGEGTEFLSPMVIFCRGSIRRLIMGKMAMCARCKGKGAIGLAIAVKKGFVEL